MDCVELDVAEGDGTGLDDKLELSAPVDPLELDAAEELSPDAEDAAVDPEAVPDASPDPDELLPVPPKHPVGTPKQLNCAVPQNWPNLQDQVSPR